MSAKAKDFPDDHPTRKLFLELHSVEPYPPGVVRVREQIRGTSFFPGGTGLWCEGRPDVPPLPVGRIMVLGHDYHSETGYEESLVRVAENLQKGTWLHLRDVLRRADVQLEDCFFTNIYMGLREGDGKKIGPFAGSKCPQFKQRCRNFFLKQFQIQRPNAILALGANVPPFLAPLSPQLSEWSKSQTYAELDSHKRSLIHNVSFDRVPEHKCAIACLIHPSLRHANVKGRRWGAAEGDRAEIQMIREAVLGH